MEDESPVEALDKELKESDVENVDDPEEAAEDRLLSHFLPQDRAGVGICKLGIGNFAKSAFPFQRCWSNGRSCNDNGCNRSGGYCRGYYRTFGFGRFRFRRHVCACYGARG